MRDLDWLRGLHEAPDTVVRETPCERCHGSGVERVGDPPVDPEWCTLCGGSAVDVLTGDEVLRRAAPELLDCIAALAHVRSEALATLEHHRARATGGMLTGMPKMNISTAIMIERETRDLDALDARLRAMREAGHG